MEFSAEDEEDLDEAGEIVTDGVNDDIDKVEEEAATLDANRIFVLMRKEYRYNLTFITIFDMHHACICICTYNVKKIPLGLDGI